MWLGAEAIAHGKGGISYVSRITGVTRNTISRGCLDLRQNTENVTDSQSKRIRKEGGGRKPLSVSNEMLVKDMEPKHRMT